MRWTKPPAKKAGAVDANKALAAIARNDKEACFGDCSSCTVNCKIARVGKKIQVVMVEEPAARIPVRIG